MDYFADVEEMEYLVVEFIATATPGDNCSGSVIFQLPLSAKFGSVGGCLALHKLFKYPRHLYFFRNNEALHVYMNKVSRAFVLCFTQSDIDQSNVIFDEYNKICILDFQVVVLLQESF